MNSGLESILCEDLGEAQLLAQKTLEVLCGLEQSIAEGHITQPSREDSKRLTRLVALA